MSQNGSEQTIQVTQTTTITNVVIRVEVNGAEETLVVTRVPSGDTLRFPMTAKYAGDLRRKWNAAARKPKKVTS